MSLWKVNNKVTSEKIEEYSEEEGIFFRFQEKDWEMGTQSWGMIYDSAEEAIENCEDDGLAEDEAVLNGKSCCSTAQELYKFADAFDSDFRVLVLSGDYVEEGHDGEDVVDVVDVKEIWSFEEFMDYMNSLEENQI